MKSVRPQWTHVVYLLIVLFIAASLVDGFLSAPGTFDDYAFLEWGKALIGPGPFTGYNLLRHKVDLDYPPLGVTLIWLSLSIGHTIGWPDLLSLKSMIAMFSVAGALTTLARRPALEDALLLMLIVTPFGLMLGYTDAAYLPFLLLAMYAGEASHFATAGLALALSAFIKWQPIILVPLFLIAAFRNSRTTRGFALATLPAVILVLLVSISFSPAAVWDVFLAATSETYLSGQGANVGWLVSAIFEAFHVGGLAFQPNGGVAMLMTPSPIAAIGDAMLALRTLFYLLFTASLVIYTAGCKTSAALLVSALACAVTQFTWNTGVHENHFFVSMVISFTCWQAKVLDNLMFAAIIIMGSLNVLLFYGFGDGFNFSNSFDIDATVLLSVSEVLIYIAVVTLQVRVCLGPAPQRTPITGDVA